MSESEAGSCDLPLLVAGLPAPVRACLRSAGVPFVPLEGGGQPRGRRQRRAQPRFVLYDSRDASSRREVDGLRPACVVPIDLAPCLARAVDRLGSTAPNVDGTSGDERQLSCSRLLSLLKQAIESADGLWARVPEVPFPWHYDPALWTPSPPELLAWRRVRSRICLEIARTPKAYQIAASGDFGGFRPAIELWRGRHVASFELQPGGTTLAAGGLVYQQRSDRAAEASPSVRPDDSQITLNAARIKPQSA
ncbi:MAG TPA: hypothetical protein VML55_03485 [Planctomycetaceae bacterium]|nr:hypothetical protein [Planctomycetaceae bacterium]